MRFSYRNYFGSGRHAWRHLLDNGRADQYFCWPNYPAKESKKIKNNANSALSRTPSIATQGLDSLRLMLKIPTATPATPGKTRSNALIALSAVKDKPESEDSNTVKRTRNRIDRTNKAMDFAPRLNFI
jgi:hypothetical protein